MYDPRENRIIIDGEDKTDSVERCWYTSRPNRCQVVFCNFPKTYSYVPSKVLWLKDPVVFDPQHCHLLHKGRRIEPLSYIAAFQQGARRFWYVEYANGTGAHYKGSEVELVRSCLEEPPAQDRFAYLRDVAELNPLETDDGQKLLLMQYQKIDFVSDRSAAALYLNPGKDSPRQFRSSTPSGATPASREPSRQPSGIRSASSRALREPARRRRSSTSWPILWCRRRPCWSSRTTTRPSKMWSRSWRSRGWDFSPPCWAALSERRPSSKHRLSRRPSRPRSTRGIRPKQTLRNSSAPSSPKPKRCKRFSNGRSGWLVLDRSCRGCKPNSSISSRRQRLIPPSRFVDRCRQLGC